MTKTSATIKIERFFYHNKNLLLWVHIAMFIAFSGLVFAPVFLPTPAENATPSNNFTVFANFMMWGLWFPLVLLSTIFTGRSWCGLLCPMGAASQWASKFGLKRPIPPWLKWEGTPVLAFILVTIWGQTVGVRDYADSIAIVFGSIMLAAIVLGFIFTNNKRPWCRHACPIGLLLGVFSRLSIVHFTPKNTKPLNSRYNEKGACPTMIKLASKDESRHCIQCFECSKPDSNAGLRLEARYAGKEAEDIAKHNPNLSEVFFLFMSTGVTLGGFLWLSHPIYQQLRNTLGEWFIDNNWYWIFESGSAWLMSVHPEQREVFSWLDFVMIVGFMLGCMILVTIILGITTAIVAKTIPKNNDSFIRNFTIISYQYTPIAMVSIIIGLGGDLFDTLGTFGFSTELISATKLSFLYTAVLWSIWIGIRILRNRSIIGRALILPTVIGAIGSVLLGIAWHKAMFG